MSELSSNTPGQRQRGDSSRIPFLPAEIWIRILSYHTDLTHLWMSCRLVSPAFLAYTEHVFCRQHIKKMRIEWHLSKTRHPTIRDYSMHFKKFSDDKEKKRAIFKYLTDAEEAVILETKGRGAVAKSYEQKLQSWVNANKDGKWSWYTIIIGGLVNDTEMSELKLDTDKVEMSFDWRGTLTAFYKEQERLQVLRGRWEAEIRTEAAQKRMRLALRKSIPRFADPDEPRPWSQAQLEIRQQVRRERLKQRHANDEKMLWVINGLKYSERAEVGFDSEWTWAFGFSELPKPSFGPTTQELCDLITSVRQDEWHALQRIDDTYRFMKPSEFAVIDHGYKRFPSNPSPLDRALLGFRKGM